MTSNCLRCSNPLKDDYQLIFDEIGTELQLDKQIAEFFNLYVIQDETAVQALCSECVDRLTELFDVAQKSDELQKPTELASPLIQQEKDVFEDEIFLEKFSDNEPFEGKGGLDLNTSQSDDEDCDANDSESTENIDNFKGDDFDSVNIQEYIRLVIKSEMEEISYEHAIHCRICNEFLTSHTAILMHTASNHENLSKSYPCIICDEVCDFTSTRDVAFHIAIKHYDLEKIIIYCLCPECGKKFSTLPEYNKHSCLKANVNRMVKECLPCSKKFVSNKRYRFHLQFHLDKRRPKACVICDILFSDENDFFEHIMYSHEKKDSLICKKCDRICTTKELYNNHVKLHSAIRGYKCPQCPRSYLYNHMLLNHISIYHSRDNSNQETKCKICNKTLTSKYLLKRHMQLKHIQETEENLSVCSICGLVESSPDEINNHIAEDSCREANVISECLKLVFACEYCELAYNSIDSLKSHRKTHEKKEFVCSICKSNYSEYKKLKTHISTHKQWSSYQKSFPVNRHYVCDIDACDKSYLTWPSLHAHKARHIAYTEFTCKLCNITFRSQTALNSHLKAHDNNDEYPCQFCSKICVTQAALTIHISRKHNTNRKSCPTCKATYATDEALQEHINTNHKQLKCEFCKRTMKNKRNLQIHIDMVHSKVKRFFCRICNKGYYNNGDLKVHEKTTHLNADKLKCQQCDFTTSYESSLEIHLLKHTTQKPFKCDQCSREFTRKTCFKLHILRHSKDRPFICPVKDCGRSFVMKGILNSHLRDSHLECKTDADIK